MTSQNAEGFTADQLPNVIPPGAPDSEHARVYYLGGITTGQPNADGSHSVYYPTGHELQITTDARA
ncbi:MAG: hypothetical protein ACREGA_03920 [Candidatus Saccharimonadales bacterium]